MEAVAANSKWWLGLGRQRGVFGSRSRKQSLLSINGVGYTRKMMMMRNNMNCMRRFRLESSWMGMGMGPRAIEMQRFKAEAASGSGQGDVENGDASPAYAMDKHTVAYDEYCVATCLGVGLLMFGIGCLLGYYLLSNSTDGIMSRLAFMAIVLLHAHDSIRPIVKSLLVGELVREGLLLPTSFPSGDGAHKFCL